MGADLFPIDIPPQWSEVELDRVRDVLLVVGAPDAGKSTFCRYLFERLQGQSRPVAYLDGDPGQGSLGPPTTMTLALGRTGDDTFPPQGQIWRSFVGSTSPSGHMLPVLVGAARLVQRAYQAGANVVLYDTSGLIDPAQGGGHLKRAKINLLRPTWLFAIRQGKELEPLLRPLRRSGRVRVVELGPSRAARRRDPASRRAYRTERFARYFQKAQTITLEWTRLAVFPGPSFTLHRLVALEDKQGFTLGLGLVTDMVRETRRVSLLTPVPSLERVDAISLGDLEVDPATFMDLPLGKRG